MEKDICEWLAKKVVHYKQLRGGVVFVEMVPKTASGKVVCRHLLLIKILRRQLKDVPALQKIDAKSKL
jgi:acyl-coenzyme A synthetase/AMP-(fatty) acid ligase